MESERKVDLDCVVCKHTDCVHPSGVGFREGGVYSTIISTAVGTVDYVQQYRSGTGIAVYPRYKIASLLKGNYSTYFESCFEYLFDLLDLLNLV